LDRRADRIVDRDPAARLARFPDHALPRHRSIGDPRRDFQGGTRDARPTGKPRELGNLAVREDVTFRDPPDRRVDVSIQHADVCR
jgi:hypothetical protein